MSHSAWQIPPHTSPISTKFVYDGRSRRAEIIEKQGVQTIADRKFVWTGNNIMEERDASNAVVKRFYKQGVRVGFTNYYYKKDRLGSIREILDNAGTLIASYDYDLWGNRTQTDGALAADYGYAGYFEHARSGLALTRYRAYSSHTGRWLSRDPIGIRGGLNLYGYVGNHPLLGRDPLGLDWLDDTANFSAGFGDRLTFGLTARARNALGGDNVNMCSGWYGGGEGAAYAWMFAMSTEVIGAAAEDFFADEAANMENLPPDWNEDWQWNPASREGEGWHWWDPDGGEWHWHDADPWHDPHWDYNPWDNWNSPWQHGVKP